MKRAILLVCLALLFLAGSAAAQAERKDGRVFWKGEVDGKIQLVITGLSITSRTISGRQLAEGNHSFTAPLPRDVVTVAVRKMEGRGDVAVVQQPSADNDFTAIVEITDERGDSDDYLLDITWQ